MGSAAVSAVPATSKIKGVASLPPDLRKLAPKLLARLDFRPATLEQLYRWGGGEALTGQEVRALVTALLADGKAERPGVALDTLLRESDQLVITDRGRQALAAEAPKPKAAPPPPPAEDDEDEEEEEEGEPEDDEDDEEIVEEDEEPEEPEDDQEQEPASEPPAEEAEAEAENDAAPDSAPRPRVSRRSPYETRALILGALSNDPKSQKRIEEETGLASSTVSVVLGRLLERKEARKGRDGWKIGKVETVAQDRKGVPQVELALGNAQKVLDAIKGGTGSLQGLFTATCMGHSVLHRALRRLLDAGKIERTGNGRYKLIEAAPAQAPAAEPAPTLTVAPVPAAHAVDQRALDELEEARAQVTVLKDKLADRERRYAAAERACYDELTKVKAELAAERAHASLPPTISRSAMAFAALADLSKAIGFIGSLVYDFNTDTWQAWFEESGSRADADPVGAVYFALRRETAIFEGKALEEAETAAERDAKVDHLYALAETLKGGSLWSRERSTSGCAARPGSPRPTSRRSSTPSRIRMGATSPFGLVPARARPRRSAKPCGASPAPPACWCVPLTRTSARSWPSACRSGSTCSRRTGSGCGASSRRAARAPPSTRTAPATCSRSASRASTRAPGARPRASLWSVRRPRWRRRRTS